LNCVATSAEAWRIGAVGAIADHNVPIPHNDQGIADPISRLQVETLDENVVKYQ
jgi:3-isopropylmalate/(R)-2-methylmalate dehydratase large subunit